MAQPPSQPDKLVKIMYYSLSEYSIIQFYLYWIVQTLLKNRLNSKASIALTGN